MAEALVHVDVVTWRTAILAPGTKGGGIARDGDSALRSAAVAAPCVSGSGGASLRSAGLRPFHAPAREADAPEAPMAAQTS